MALLSGCHRHSTGMAAVGGAILAGLRAGALAGRAGALAGRADALAAALALTASAAPFLARYSGLPGTFASARRGNTPEVIAMIITLDQFHSTRSYQ